MTEILFAHDISEVYFEPNAIYDCENDASKKEKKLTYGN